LCADFASIFFKICYLLKSDTNNAF